VSLRQALAYPSQARASQIFVNLNINLKILNYYTIISKFPFFREGEVGKLSSLEKAITQQIQCSL